MVMQQHWVTVHAGMGFLATVCGNHVQANPCLPAEARNEELGWPFDEIVLGVAWNETDKACAYLTFQDYDGGEEWTLGEYFSTIYLALLGHPPHLNFPGCQWEPLIDTAHGETRERRMPAPARLY